MSLTDRDRKIVLILAPLLVLLVYWFLILTPKRDEAAKAGQALSKAEQHRDTSQAEAARLQQARTSFAADYAELIRLGKAIPTSVDMPSLIVQLDAAARGTGIKFKKIATGSDQGGASSAAPAATPPATPGNSSNGPPPAAAGGAQAQSGPGKAVESAGNATNKANNSNSQNAAQQSSTGSSDTQTSTQAGKGSLPVGGGGGAAQAPAGGSGCAPGLSCVPLQFEFTGGFFDLADFFHSLKRFVQVVNDKVMVRGRLLTIDSLSFASDPTSFPKLKADVQATVYLAPKTEGPTGGATPQGPATNVPASTGSSSSPSSPSSSTATPTATAPAR